MEKTVFWVLDKSDKKNRAILVAHFIRNNFNLLFLISLSCNLVCNQLFNSDSFKDHCGLNFITAKKTF